MQQNLKKPVVTKDDVYLIKKDENPLETSDDKDVSKSYVQKYQNHTSKNIKIIHQDVSKSYTNDTNFNDTYYNHTDNNDMNDMNDSFIKKEDNIHSYHTNYQKNEFDNEALKYHLLQELPNHLKAYLSNFDIKDIEIIKSVLLKAKKSFNKNNDTIYRLEDIEFEMINVLKRFKAMLIQKEENVKSMQGYLMQSIKAELEETHTITMRRQNNPQYNLFNR